MIKIDAPFTKDKWKDIHAGDTVLLTGRIITARDQAHKRAIIENNTLIKDAVIFYTGPTFKDGHISSCGPTTSSRMDPFYQAFIDLGMAASIGKGPRAKEIIRLSNENNVPYFIIPGGLGALTALSVQNCELLAYPDLKSEAIYALDVKDLKLIVAYDIYGNSIFE